MARFDVTIVGLPELDKAVKTLSEDARRDVHEQVYATCLDIRRAARETVPVRTGALKGSVIADVPRKALSGEVRAGDVSAPYAAYVEFGTRRMRAQPYLFPAAEQARRPFEKAVADVIRAAAQREAK